MVVQALRRLQEGPLLQPGLSKGFSFGRERAPARVAHRSRAWQDDWNDHRDECGKDKGLPFSNPQRPDQVQMRSTGQIDDGVFLDRLTEQELHTWNNQLYWNENEKHLLQELWKTFERDGQVPVEDPESRSLREMFKWLGSQPAFHFL